MKKELETKEGITITATAFETLTAFLLAKEYDISIDWENLGDLKDLFKEIIGRAAGKKQ